MPLAASLRDRSVMIGAGLIGIANAEMNEPKKCQTHCARVDAKLLNKYQRIIRGIKPVHLAKIQ
jgi:hypothetical protein